jgi:uncharacterized damage-inducible protein DinB
MSEMKRLSELMRRAFEGEAWHGPSLLEALDGVDAARAAARPIPSAHSIFEIVLHVGGWEEAIRRRVLGQGGLEPEEGDWPEVEDASEAGWAAALERLRRNNAALRETVAGFRDDQLDEKLPSSEATLYATLHGVMQHSLYHAGQIAVLRKAETEA